MENNRLGGNCPAEKKSPHLILLDIRLPDGSGFDFFGQMRQQGLHQPIIILTAQHDEVDKILGLEMGADDYVTKPFSLCELLSRIRAQLRRAYGDYAVAESAAVLVAFIAGTTPRACPAADLVWRLSVPLWNLIMGMAKLKATALDTGAVFPFDCR